MTRLTLAEFDLGPLLGVGTVGEVYSARLKSTGEAVAVKLLLLSLSQDELIRARFRREMMILEKLQHPNVIHYFGGGEHDGRLFYAMEHVAGGTVKELLERFQRLSWSEVASIARQVCSALQHAHNHGIIHRDLKPGNLFLDHQGRVKLGDFGIARDTHSADLTHQGLTVGTHAYMSPEQIVGDENITGAADLYSLGCVLFELLTGQKPFNGTNFAVLFEQHWRKPPPKVSDLVPDCPAELCQLVDRLLAKKPEDRPFNARAVQGAVMELLAQAGHHSEQLAEKTQATQATQATGHPPGSRGDVAATQVIDPGMEMLARKLQAGEQPTVSWKAMAVLGLAAVVLIAIVAAASKG